VIAEKPTSYYLWEREEGASQISLCKLEVCLFLRGFLLFVYFRQALRGKKEGRQKIRCFILFSLFGSTSLGKKTGITFVGR